MTTVAAANDAADDTPVVLQGYVIKKVNNDDKYEFKDSTSTSTITVEIDNEDMPGVPFNENTKVKLTGEVEKKLMSREIDVDRVEVIN
ncbi:Bacterial OB fold (BOF) protein [compost metagenome]